MHRVADIRVGRPDGVQDVAASAVDTGGCASNEGGASGFRRGVPACEIIACLRADADIARLRHGNQTIILELVDCRFRASAAIGVIGHGDGSLNRHVVCRQGDIAALHLDKRARIVLVAGAIRPVGEHHAVRSNEGAVGHTRLGIGTVFGGIDHISAGAIACRIGQGVGRADENGLDGDVAVQRLVDIYGGVIAIDPLQQGQIMPRDVSKCVLVNIRTGNGSALRKTLFFVTENVFLIDRDGDSDIDLGLCPVGIEHHILGRHGAEGVRLGFIIDLSGFYFVPAHEVRCYETIRNGGRGNALAGNICFKHDTFGGFAAHVVQGQDIAIAGIVKVYGRATLNNIHRREARN